jgi:Tfp pilus assembly protein PilV
VKKLRNSRGETLVEALASILIATLSILTLLTGLAAAFQMNQAARQADESFYQWLNAAETQKAPLDQSQVEVKMDGAAPVTIAVDVFGGEGLYSYRSK